METIKKEMLKTQVTTNGRTKVLDKYSWNIFLLFYLIGVIAMIYTLFAPIGDINLWIYFNNSFLRSLNAIVADAQILLYVKVFLGCMVFKAVSLSIWFGKNI